MTTEEARKRLFAEAIAELKQAAIFIRTPETMHPVGVKVYDGLIKRMVDFDREFGA